MSPQVFDDIPRSDSHWQRDPESSWEFLNRVDGDYWDYVRQIIEAWFAWMPASGSKQLLGRLRSGDDSQFRSAFLELYVHETLRRAGWSVEVEPALNGTGTRPDFLARRGQQRVIIEVTARGTPREVARRAHRRGHVWQAIDDVIVGDVGFRVVELTVGPQDLRLKELKDQLTFWANEVVNSPVDPGPFMHCRQGWVIHLEAVRNVRVPGAPGKSRGIALGAIDASFPTHDETLRSLIAKKDCRYGEMGLPYVICVGANMIETDDWFGVQTFYGRHQVTLATDESGEEVFVPAPLTNHGYFMDHVSPRRTHVSGVWVADNVSSSGPHVARNTMWVNPNAAHALEDPTLGGPLRVARCVGQEIRFSETQIEAANFLELDEQWLGARPWLSGEPWRAPNQPLRYPS